jgi:hypothetical protein
MKKVELIMNDDKNQMDFVGHIVNLEDAQNVPLPTDDKTFTDTELEQAGLVKTSAFIRTKKSKNALRIEKHKQKKADSGVKQLNIEVLEQHREVFKALAKELATTGTIQQSKMDYFAKLVSADENTTENKRQALKNTPEDENGRLAIESVKIANKCAKIILQGGFKARLLKLIV